jgi:phage recombination protein Bet
MTPIEKAKNTIAKTNENVVKSKTALTSLANKIQVSPDSLQNVLMKTVCKDMKTNEEFITFVSVANQYNLNPLLKEIYAYPDKKGGIVPIVSTDGWTRIMTTHPFYKSHSYRYAETETNVNNKNYPSWCECIISKKDGSEIVIREYLDEVYRDLNFVNPWKTHTMRMFRHKTKIQAAREAFGFSNLYDKDEGERIIEAQTVEIEEKTPQLDCENGVPKEEPQDTPPNDEPEKITETNLKHLFAECGKYKVSHEKLKGYLKETLGIESTKDIQAEFFEMIISWVKEQK